VADGQIVGANRSDDWNGHTFPEAMNNFVGVLDVLKAAAGATRH